MSSAYDAVHRQPGEPLVGPHGGLGGRAETAINGDRGDAALVGAHEVEVELQLSDAVPVEPLRSTPGYSPGRRLGESRRLAMSL